MSALGALVSSFQASALSDVKCGSGRRDLPLWVAQIDEKMQAMSTDMTWQVPDSRKTTAWADPSDYLSKL